MIYKTKRGKIYKKYEPTNTPHSNLKFKVYNSVE